MRALLAAVLLALASGARAQSRAGIVVEAPVTTPGNQSGSLSGALTGGGAPQLVTLNLAAPTLTPSPAFAASALKPVLAPAAANAATTALPESAIAPAQPKLKPLVVIKPAEAVPPSAQAALNETSELPGNLDDISVSDLIDATKRLFGESSRPGFKNADYMRLGEPVEFGESEVFRYRSALTVHGARTGTEELKSLLSASEALAKSAGIAVEQGEREMLDGTVSPVLKIKPLKDGHRLNRLAWDLKRSFGVAIEYAPQRTRGGVAAYNSTDNVLFLPDFGNEKAFEAILHESRHAYFAQRLRAGDISVFHGALLAYDGRSIAPNAESYDKYMSFEELSTHAKTLLHALMRAQHGDSAAVSQATNYGFQLMDVLRSAEINLFQLQRKLAAGELKTYRVVSPTFPEFKGGHWEALNLPHAIMAFPVYDEAPAPKRTLWNRMFGSAPDTPAAKALRRQVAALRPLIAATSTELQGFLRALRGDAPDLTMARAAAVRMTRLAKNADDAFAASR